MINVQEEAKGRYEILRVVNRGGMGEIALGRVRGTKGFEKLVVLKRLRADAEREDHLQMFDVEQELMSRIEHPNIVKVFDQPIIEGIPYLAMEYVRGRNLDQVIRQIKDGREQVSPQFCLTVISEVLRGLAFVHRLKDDEGNALGVVHQDITPSNIMVSFFGEVKITDFGISYVTSRDGGLRRGVLKGKPRYVAPEVLAGKRVNNRADIYGVGVVLYELMTLNPLFARPTVKDTLAAVARGEVPDFSKTIPGYTEGIGKIFLKALAKDPADRYRTAEEMGADVVAELAKLGGAISPARLSYLIRQQFRSDPDVPEIDPAFEEALAAEAQPVLPSSFRPPDLSQTLSELDRLLGPQSTDLFTLPSDLKSELAGIADMEPFLALTPIPDFVWDAPNEAELLRRAHKEFGDNNLHAQPLKEVPPLIGPSTSSPQQRALHGAELTPLGEASAPGLGMGLGVGLGVGATPVAFRAGPNGTPSAPWEARGKDGAVPPGLAGPAAKRAAEPMEVLDENDSGAPLGKPLPLAGNGLAPAPPAAAGVPPPAAAQPVPAPSAAVPAPAPVSPPAPPAASTGVAPATTEVAAALRAEATPGESTATPPASKPEAARADAALVHANNDAAPVPSAAAAPAGRVASTLRPLPRPQPLQREEARGGQFWFGLVLGLTIGLPIGALLYGLMVHG